MILKVLIVEDDPNRMRIFRQLFASEEVVWAQNVTEGIEWLQSTRFDLVMLDHDLADEHYENLDHAATVASGTGREVAQHMTTMVEAPPFAFVHSWNPTGARAIGDILTEAGISNVVMPFGSSMLDSGIKEWRRQAHALNRSIDR